MSSGINKAFLKKSFIKLLICVCTIYIYICSSIYEKWFWNVIDDGDVFRNASRVTSNRPDHWHD